MKLRVAVIALSGALSACSMIPDLSETFPDRSKYYLDAREMAELTLPEGASASSLNNLYVLPDAVEGPLMTDENQLKPKPLVASDAEQFVRVQALDGESWVVMELSTGEAWPRVRSFFEGNRLPLQQVDGKTGVLETNWLTSKTDPSVVERYRIAVEPGVQPSTAEVHVQQKSSSRDAMDTIVLDWEAASDSSERERWMVMELANYLVQDASSASVSLLAQGISEASRVRLIEDADVPAYIELQLGFDRAWAAMTLALKKAEFEVDDRNRSQGRYFMTYKPAAAGEDGKPGFWSSLFGSDAEQVEHFGTTFQLVLRQLNKDTVTIELVPEKAGFPEDDRRALLEILKSNIS
ncbi:MAG TPA: outer membrane protein assembly factor BamC [Pseudomonadales bacterium]|nr:outer membrane protein assembly factor BamC [Pseudomonadales bacterium]